MQNQEPTQCDKCGAKVFKIGETRTDVIYQCFSRHIIYVLKIVVMTIPVQGKPRDAA